MSTKQTDTANPFLGIASAIAIPSGISMARIRPEKSSVALKRIMKAFRGQYLLKPLRTHPKKLVVAEGILDRIIYYRHQRDDGTYRNKHEHRQDHKPGFIVLNFHSSPSTCVALRFD